MDTPPAMRAATLNGLAVADTVLIPVDGSSYLVLLGLNQLLQVVAAYKLIRMQAKREALTSLDSARDAQINNSELD